MALLDINNHVLKMRVTYSGSLSAESLIPLLGKIKAFHVAHPLKKVELKGLPPDPLAYSHDMDTVSGSKWRMTFLMDSDDPLFDFDDVHDMWRVSDYTLHRPIRDELIRLVRDLGVTRIEVTFE